MKRPPTLLLIAFIEILFGAVTILATSISLVLSTNTKAPNVLVFVFVTSSASALLGLGLLQLKKTAYILLVYFSSVIVLSKILIFANIITLNGSLETSVPLSFKNSISIFYHTLVIYYLTGRNVKALFIK